jgi:hypothetical protein
MQLQLAQCTMQVTQLSKKVDDIHQAMQPIPHMLQLMQNLTMKFEAPTPSGIAKAPTPPSATTPTPSTPLGAAWINVGNSCGPSSVSSIRNTSAPGSGCTSARVTPPRTPALPPSDSGQIVPHGAANTPPGPPLGPPPAHIRSQKLEFLQGQDTPFADTGCWHRGHFLFSAMDDLDLHKSSSCPTHFYGDDIYYDAPKFVEKLQSMMSRFSAELCLNIWIF